MFFGLIMTKALAARLLPLRCRRDFEVIEVPTPNWQEGFKHLAFTNFSILARFEDRILCLGHFLAEVEQFDLARLSDADRNRKIHSCSHASSSLPKGSSSQIALICSNNARASLGSEHENRRKRTASLTDLKSIG